MRYLIGERALQIAPYFKVWLARLPQQKYHYLHDRIECTVGQFGTWLAAGTGSHNSAVELEIAIKKYARPGGRLPMPPSDWNLPVRVWIPHPAWKTQPNALDSLRLDKLGGQMPAVITFLRMIGA